MINFGIKGPSIEGIKIIDIFKRVYKNVYNPYAFCCNNPDYIYYVNKDNNISMTKNASIFKFIYTVGEFEKKYPFKIGDTVKIKDVFGIYKIIDFNISPLNRLSYILNNGLPYITEKLELYKQSEKNTMKKLNIAEILKDCPTGMELDCTMFNCLELVRVNEYDESNYPIICRVKKESDKCRLLTFTKYGSYTKESYSKCVIFPKGKTTWEGFQRPFKDGDVVVCKPNEKIAQMFILKSQTNEMKGYCYTGYDFRCNDFFKEGIWYFDRLATEEEKQKLFDAIKANGYKWNAKTKTLEKLIEPKFKVGDRVRNKNYKVYIYDIQDITDKGYRAKEITTDSPILILFGSQEDNYELIPNKFDITTLKAFDKVLVRDNDRVWWSADIYSHHLGKDKPYQFKCIGATVKQCIPYEGNEHLLGTTNDCNEYYKTW